jgi:BirA family biotin operon repressor/biotin-[acetyl-CoA-carboxylase] ligase
MPREFERRSGWTIHRTGAVGSTQDVARAHLDAWDGQPTAFLAVKQRQGRGRHGRCWLSPEGGLYVSFLVPPHPLLFAHAALAVAEALDSLGVRSELLWPNDVFVRQRKIAGILIEVVSEVAVVGVGVNLNSAPLECATCLATESSESVAVDDLLHAILQCFDALQGKDLLARYKKRCASLGTLVEYRAQHASPDAGTTGEVVDIDTLGRLVVQGDAGCVTLTDADLVIRKPAGS